MTNGKSNTLVTYANRLGCYTYVLLAFRGLLCNFMHSMQLTSKISALGTPALRSISLRYFTELLHLKLRSRLQSPQAIEDVRQETFARVLAGLGSLERFASPKAWAPS